jgi:preprotein translocase subunit SecD
MVRKSAKLKSSAKSKYSTAWKVGLIVLMILGSLWQLYPSLRYLTMSDQARAAMDPGKLEKLKNKSLKLGLDLQGGIHLVMQVDTKGMDEKAAADAVDRAMTVIGNRVNQFGLTEPVVQKQGTNRIIIELPGERDVERAKELIGKTARLEFKLLKSDQDLKFVTDKIDLYLSGVKEAALPDSAANAAGADSTKVAATDTAKAATTAKAAPDTSKKGAFDQQAQQPGATGAGKKFSSLLE